MTFSFGRLHAGSSAEDQCEEKNELKEFGPVKTE